MCGIAGIVSVEGRAPAHLHALEVSVNAMHQRGPDASSVWTGEWLSLGHARLAIIDRAHGDQPMFSDDGRYVVVFNGEIYNHHALRRDLEMRGCRFRTKCDTEVLLALYAEKGAAMVEDLHGMFAFAVFDLEERRGMLARDRFGKKPLFLADLPGGFAFASTLDGLLPLLRDRPTIDEHAIAQYLVLQYVPAPLTPFAGAKKLPPGHVATWGPDGLKTFGYWRPPLPGGDARDRGLAVARVREVVGQAVRARLESEAPLGVFLSGGLDSSTVVAEMASSGVRPRTFSVGFRSFTFDESRYARMVADAFDTDHHELVADDDVPALFDDLVRAYDEPFADSSALATLAVSKAAAEHLTVVLTGDGGDEMFWGYDRYRVARLAMRVRGTLGPLAGPLARVGTIVLGAAGIGRAAAAAEFVRKPWDAYRDRLTHFPPDRARALLPIDAANVDPGRAISELDRLWEQGAQRPSSLPWLDSQTYLPGDLLVKMDRATMAFSVEARAPLLDHEIAELCATFPSAWMHDARGGKAMLRAAYADVLPREILRRPKQGFGVPLDVWMRGPLQPAIDDLLIASKGPLDGILDTTAVSGVARAFLKGDERLRWQTWNLLALAGWASIRVGSSSRWAHATP